MVELASADAPDVVCLQEVPVWALPHLAGWSSMTAFPAVARRPLLPIALSKWVTRTHQGRLRSAVTGQANAILVSPRHEATELGSRQISEPGRERRVVHAVRVGAGAVVANLHASNVADRELVLGEVERARAFAEEVAPEGDVVVLAGDFNAVEVRLPGYSEPTAGIDHVLVRGAAVSPALVWPSARRERGAVVLSDHAPVEVTVG